LRHDHRDRSRVMQKLIGPVLGALVATLGVVSAAVAGPAEDALAAFDRGDYATALRLFRPLADQGNAAAQNRLGFMYVKGRGVPQDDAEAARWYRLAADQGLSAAQFILGSMYAVAQGVPRDFVRAHMWLNLAAAQNYEDAGKMRDLIGKLMTPAQIAEAQKLAGEWKPK